MIIDATKRALLPALLVLAVLAAAPAGPALAQDADECLQCHEDQGLTKNVKGKVVSLYVDIDKFNKSIHGQEGIGCVDCHADLQGFEDWPHPEELKDVDCTQCHSSIGRIYANSLHGQVAAKGEPLAPRCWSCHGAHDIRPPTDPESTVNRFNIPLMCGRCHKEGSPVADFSDIEQDSVLTHYKMSIHGEGLYKRGLTKSAVCSDCHTAHDVRDSHDPKSSISRERVAQTCQQCHGRIEDVHTKVIEGRLWEAEPHKVPACVECHQPHEIRRVFYNEGMSDRECLKCHAQEGLHSAMPGREAESMTVDQAELVDSAHQNVRCIQCHTGATPTHDRPCDTIPSRVDCAVCHAGVVDVFMGSIHGKLRNQGDPDGPDCRSCHGTHHILKHDNPASPTHVRNVPDLCGRCHDEGGIADRRYEGTEHSMVKNYKESVHGRALKSSGLVVTATCIDCHTTHAILPSKDVKSSVSRANVADTCGKCHQGIDMEFRKS
ncbi:MAG TPA: cytochrome c3 family protein, partial [Candidatus Krumholzibacteria bacterium]|nr:cytochrome c3 family protein [Candidatus Krumholzibacteria bacterium]